MSARSCLVVAVVLLAGCSGGTEGTTQPTAPSRPSTPVTEPAVSTSTVDTTPATPVPPDTGISWQPIDDELDEGFLDVPLDWNDPSGPTIPLYLVRHRAADPSGRIGSLLVNPGGPGSPGTELARYAPGIYGQALVDRFDIIGWDPRGTGRSEPRIECGDEYDRWFAIDPSPDDDAEHRALVDTEQSLAAGCAERSGPGLVFVDTASSARDIDAIRRALGEERISYFGWSYGSELGAVWATLFPDTVRAAVLDGAIDPTIGYFEQNVQQASGFERALGVLLDECSADRTCPFHNDGRAAEAFDRLAADIDRNPLGGERTPITQGVFTTAVIASLYDDTAWFRLEQALADAQRGDGAGLLELYDEYYEIEPDGRNRSNLTESYFAIGCLDDPGTTSPDELFDRADELATAAPRLGPSYQLELAVCSVWPQRPRNRVQITGKDAGPIVVVGTTGDTATPLAATQAMAATLQEGRLVTVTAEQHTGYGANACVDDAVESYLIDPSDLPEEGLTC